MISGAGLNHMPANAAAIFGDRYRRIPEALAFVLAIVISLASALVTGLLGAGAAIYLYDRANSKGDDAAVGLGGLFAIGTFMFVVVFTWLQKLHHPISSRTPSYALLACLILPAAATLLALSESRWRLLTVPAGRLGGDRTLQLCVMDGLSALV
jgi:apolipoprotein N-acyltransferase